ncbi:MAG: SGNH/GDSL hydrolase family protein [Kiritimatiellia bacterium]|jgi:hypothetical protein
MNPASFADFDARARAGERLVVAFFGGSLTWSANASDPNRTGFRGRMADYLEEKYPAAHFTFVDAALGGTGSKLGIFRLDRDVLAKKPDLVFLDFICNDGGEGLELSNTCCYESLLRRMIGAGVPVVQMFFTFKFWAAHGAPFDADDCHPRLVPYSRLVEAYATGVGNVYRDGLIDAIESGAIAPTRQEALDTLWPIDGGHPVDLGYAYFAQAGIAGFERAVAARLVCRVPERPVFGTVRDVRRFDPVDAPLPAGWTRKLTYRTSLWYDGLSSRWMGDVAAFGGTEPSPLSFRAKGNLFGLFGEADQDALEFDVLCDGAPVARFDAYHRAGPGRLFIWRAQNLEGWEAGESAGHEFAIVPIPSPDGKGELRIGSLCTATLAPEPEAVEESRRREAASAARKAAAEAAKPIEALDHARGKK